MGKRRFSMFHTVTVKMSCDFQVTSTVPVEEPSDWRIFIGKKRECSDFLWGRAIDKVM